MAVYPRWRIDAGSWTAYGPSLAVVLVLVILWVKRHSWSRPCFFAWVYFVIALLPIIGLVDHFFLRYSFVADHFQYLAAMGPLALVAAAITRWEAKVGPGMPWLRSILGASLVLLFGVMSWQRSWAFQSQQELWTDTLTKNPDCWVGHLNLGTDLYEKGRVDEAMDQFQKTLAIHPGYAQAHNDLGSILFEKGRLDEAMDQYQKALQIDPNSAEIHTNFGNVLSQLGRTNEAMPQYQKALKINPSYGKAYSNLGNLLCRIGHAAEAMPLFKRRSKSTPPMPRPISTWAMPFS